ncbi:hypothetical protein PF003_g18220 [Phytophthora fragariae]|nr:hypothetical protein PF003_g18220 [Phytophthora fragariae]
MDELVVIEAAEKPAHLVVQLSLVAVVAGISPSHLLQDQLDVALDSDTTYS